MPHLFALAALAAASPAPAVPVMLPLDPVSRQLHDAHNRERALVGAPPLQWDPHLARSAISYGPTLTALGRLQHSPRASRPGQREYLWYGGAYAFLPAQMVGMWAAEKRFFRPGIYPSVSTTGNWYDVSHYTQMIWPTTTHVGCGIHRTGRSDYLICRYLPPGNRDGRHIP